MFRRDDIINYYETSSINYLADNIPAELAKQSKFYFNYNGVKIITSPVSLWEIMVTSNDERKEFLIYFAQHFFEEYLPMAPSELIINYIKNGCPTKETWFNIQSDLELNKTWGTICKNTKKTLIYDKNLLVAKTKLIRKASKYIYEILKFDNIVEKDKFAVDLQIRIESIYNMLNFIKEDEKNRLIDVETKKLYRISILLIISIMCLYLDLDSSKIIEYWRINKINKIEDQINFLFANFETLVHRGPFIEMAMMAKYQFDFGKTRGLFWDCLHSLYLPYVHVFFSNDEHFIGLKEKVLHPIYQRIRECTLPQAFV